VGAVRKLVVWLGLLALIFSGCTSAGPVPKPTPQPGPIQPVMFRGGTERTGSYQTAAIASPGRMVWRAPTRGAIYSSPAVWGNRVYTANNNGVLTALDARSGRVLWRFQSAGTDMYSSPAVADNSVFVGGGYATIDDPHFYAIDATTGKLRWKLNTAGSFVASPAFSNGVVYIADNAGYAYALRADSGRVMWRSAVGGSVSSSPALSDGILYVASDDGQVSALHADTGLVLWQRSFVGQGFQATPAVAANIVYVLGSTTLYALKSRTGDTLWSASVKGGFSSPALGPNDVFALGKDGTLSARAGSSGRLIWSRGAQSAE
jgi:eukaryotic-like serine/threonine-protein kinase